MKNQPQEKVQFFQSQSSFGSESNISDYRYFDFTNQILVDTDNLFLTLRKELHPIQRDQSQEKIDYLIRRAQILGKNTIPEHARLLRKSEAHENIQQQISSCQQRLRKLLEDYESLEKGTIAYKQFYNTYGKEFGLQGNNGFSRKKDSNGAIYIETGSQQGIKPEIIEINYGLEKQKLRGATPRVLYSQSSSGNDKQVISLREEVHRLKRALEYEKKKFEQQAINEKLNYQKRMKVYLNSSLSNQQLDKNLKQQLVQNTQKLNSALQENRQLQKTIEERDKALETALSDNNFLKEQIQKLRMTESNFDEQDANKSYNSELNDREDKKSDKRIKSLLQENELLKAQLKLERREQYRLQSDLTAEERRELQRSIKNYQKTKQELQQLYNKFDGQRLQIIKLTHINKSNQKMIQSLKRENEQLKQRLSHLPEEKNKLTEISSFSIQKNLKVSRNNKIQILQYEGDGIQGYAYYQTLTKEFRIRFKRACLKEKELLYKCNGVEIGVITTFEKPNRIDILVHITNISEKPFNKVRGKFMNANENRLQGQSFELDLIAENQQIKIPVSLTVTQYPIGPLILLLEYTSEKKEDLRILLPAHISKTMVAEERDDNLSQTNSTKTLIIGEKKIFKDLSDLRQYFKLGKKAGTSLKASFFHQHTHTLLYLDAKSVEGGLQLAVQHKEGSRHITDYFFKTVAFLLTKG